MIANQGKFVDTIANQGKRVTCVANQGSVIYRDAAQYLNFVRTSGNCIVDTGYLFGSNTSIEADVIFNSSGAAMCFVGSTDGDGHIVDIHGVDFLGRGFEWYFDRLQTYTGNPPALITLGQLYTVGLTPTGGFVNGNQVVTFNPDVPWVGTSTRPLTLFSFNAAGIAASYVDNGQLMSGGLRIYESGVLVRQFVPAKDESGVVCLWEKFTKTYFYNTGAGTLLDS